jgi:tetratricopeptide (TPR) repeat protein
MPRRLLAVSLLTLFAFLAISTLTAQSVPDRSSEQAQIAPPQMRRVEPPSPNETPAALEKEGDVLRGQKLFLDALDYYAAALKKEPKNSTVHNKTGIVYLQMRRFNDAKKQFESAIKDNKENADAYNNLGVTYYALKKEGRAIKQYEKALKIREDVASYHNNLAAAYFTKKDFERATKEYGRALELDPDIFERTSQTGITAQLPSPEDRAHYDYVVAKMYAKLGVTDRSLEYLRKAMEEGYKDIGNVYKDTEFSQLRKDPRFTALMTSKPMSIPE